METSKKIADKAYALFIRYGIRSITMDKIAADLGISKKTIYRFYSNKDSLVEKFVDKVIDEHISSYKTRIEKSNDAIIELYLLLVSTREFYNILNPSIIHDLERNHESAYNKLKNHKRLFLHLALKENIQCGIKAGLYLDDFDVEVITKFFRESLTVISDPSIFGPIQYTKTEQPPEELFTYLIRGIATTRGIEIVNTYKIKGVLYP